MLVRLRIGTGHALLRRLRAAAALCCLYPTAALAADPADTLISVARFTVWPDDIDYGLSFRVCLRNDDPAIVSFLRRKGTLIQGRPMSLHSVGPAAFGNAACHAAFFSAGLADRAIIDMIGLRPVLTISAQPGFAIDGGLVEVADPQAPDPLLVHDGTLGRHPLRLRAPLLEVAGRSAP